MIFVHLILFYLFCTLEDSSLTWFTLKNGWVSKFNKTQFRQMTGFFPPMRSPPSEVIMERIQVIFNTKARTSLKHTFCKNDKSVVFLKLSLSKIQNMLFLFVGDLHQEIEGLVTYALLSINLIHPPPICIFLLVWGGISNPPNILSYIKVH